MTTELERIKILEGKISQVIDYVNKLTAENDRLKQQVKELKAGVKDYEEQSKKTVKFEEDLKRYEGEREAIKGRIEAIIGQIDKLPLPILEEARLMDLYSGESIPKDKISLSLRLVYRHPQRTLLAEEVARAEQQVLIQLKRAFGAQLREGGKIDNGTGKN